MKKIERELSAAMPILGQGPVVLVSCRHRGLDYAMPVGWITGNAYDPPAVMMTLGAWNSTFEALLAAGQCTVNVASEANARLVYQFGSCHCAGSLDKFERFGAARSPAALVDASLVDDCFASLECRAECLSRERGIFLCVGLRFWLAEDYSPERYRLLHSRGDVLYADNGTAYAKKDLLG